MPNSPIGIASAEVAGMLGRDPSDLRNPDYCDEQTIRSDLAAAGFHETHIEWIARPAKAASAHEAAVISVQGSLVRTAIEARDPSRLWEATDAVERVMCARFGDGPVLGESKALVVTTKTPQCHHRAVMGMTSPASGPEPKWVSAARHVGS